MTDNFAVNELLLMGSVVNEGELGSSTFSPSWPGFVRQARWDLASGGR